jgi:type II secretory pathway pseudopilin PulG
MSKSMISILCCLLMTAAVSAQSTQSSEQREQAVLMQYKQTINSAKKKAITGTVIFGIGKLLSWIIVYPKDKALADKLYDNSDEGSYQERDEENID